MNQELQLTTAEEQVTSIKERITQAAHQLIAAERQVKILTSTYDALSNALEGVQLGVEKTEAADKDLPF
jgi:hypothetical protein